MIQLLIGNCPSVHEPPTIARPNFDIKRRTNRDSVIDVRQRISGHLGCTES